MVEFKVNDAEPQAIGEYISALANAAALVGKAFAYLVWGVRDEDHDVVGTNFDPGAARVGNEELESWLLRLLEPKIDFRFFRVTVDVRPVVLLEIGRAARHPVRFSGQEFIRVGTYKKKLKDFPEKERALWRIFDQAQFEDGVASERAAADDVLRVLDYPAYFDLLERPLPANRDGILAALADDRLIRRGDAGGWNITNLGAILFAKRLDAFHSLRRKAVRVIQYRGTGRTETLREQEGAKGYACGFEGLIGYINGLLPANEVIQQALRKAVPMFPELAVRELVANALIHQDLFVTGAGPMVEIFDDPHRDHEPRRASGGHSALRRHAAEVAQRGARLADAPLPDLRGARQRDRQGCLSGGAVSAAGTALREAGRVHADGPVRPQAFVCDGQGGPGAGLLSTRVPALRDSHAHDQHVGPRAIRDRREERIDGFASAQRGGGGGSHRRSGPGGRNSDPQLPAVLGGSGAEPGGNCLMRNPLSTPGRRQRGQKPFQIIGL